nr:hypothetical protein [Enterobacter sichuanensis]
MDIALFPGQNTRAWAETMINLEARKLINTANIVGWGVSAKISFDLISNASGQN